MVGFGLDYACAHIIILAEISSENLLPIRADFVTERDTAFLAPPVSRCILPECRQASLSRPHPPIHATIFTLNGPLPALKCSLRCNKCATVYNYSMYGRKKQGGERYYDKQRKYVEVSDLVYCERQLFSLYCLLR